MFFFAIAYQNHIKTLPVRFFEYGLVTELLREACKGDLILSIRILAAYVPGNLNIHGMYFHHQILRKVIWLITNNCN